MWVEWIAKLTDDEHDVLMAKLNSAIMVNRSVQHSLADFADGLDYDAPWSERNFYGSTETIYTSAEVAAGCAIGDAIGEAISASEKHRAISDELWSIIQM